MKTQNVLVTEENKQNTQQLIHLPKLYSAHSRLTLFEETATTI